MRQIDYVLGVIDHGSFTAGAHALGIAQPSLSEGLRRLEDELGVRLFDRIGRRVALTDAGRAFEGPARRLVRERALALEAVDAVRALDTGTLEVVSLPTLAVDPLASLVGRFRVAHPGIVVRIAEPEQSASVEERVADGRSELGLVVLPPRRDDLVAIELERQEIVAICPPGTPLPANGKLPVARLAEMPLIGTPRGTSMRDLVDQALASAGLTAEVAVETGQREAIAPLVLAGAGASFLPRKTAENLISQGIEVARFTPPLVRTIGIVHRANPLTPAARAFVELARS
jgi:LysR family transcriptional regulator, carnitine catabolism transcriptional activator